MRIKQKEKTEFSVMLNVCNNQIGWYGGKGYFDCLRNCEQRKGYNQAAEREKEQRRIYDQLKMEGKI